MPDERRPGAPEQTPEQEPDRGYVPASPAKRVLAWMGVVYMVILIALSTYGLATGSLIRGAAGIMLAPACLAFAAIQILKARDLRRAGASPAGAVVLAAVGVLAGLYFLADGVARVAAQL